MLAPATKTNERAGTRSVVDDRDGRRGALGTLGIGAGGARRGAPCARSEWRSPSLCVTRFGGGVCTTTPKRSYKSNRPREGGDLPPLFFSGMLIALEVNVPR